MVKAGRGLESEQNGKSCQNRSKTVKPFWDDNLSDPSDSDSESEAVCGGPATSELPQDSQPLELSQDY